MLLFIGNSPFLPDRDRFGPLSQLGPVQSIHMGLIVSKDTLRLCFVEYIERKDALAAVARLSSTKLDGKIICVELRADSKLGVSTDARY
jgi:nuclear cap-binding protein subunit 2